jgi:hypothetical protein
MSSKFIFVPATTNTDGSTLTAAQIAALTFTVYADTVSPPVKSYAVAASTAIADETSGTVTIPFSAIGFVPLANTEYYCTITESNGSLTSIQSNPIQTFTNVVNPNSPTGFSIA